MTSEYLETGAIFMEKNKKSKNILILFSLIIYFIVLLSITNSYRADTVFKVWSLEGDPFWNFSMTSKVASRIFAIQRN